MLLHAVILQLALCLSQHQQSTTMCIFSFTKYSTGSTGDLTLQVAEINTDDTRSLFLIEEGVCSTLTSV